MTDGSPRDEPHPFAAPALERAIGQHRNEIVQSKHRRHSTESQHGFTLAETMVAVAVVGIMAGIGLSYLLVNLPAYRVDGAVRQITGDFRLAKSQAISRGEDVLVQFHEPSVGEYVVAYDSDASNSYTAGTDEILREVNLSELYRDIEFDTSDPGAPASAAGDGVSFQSGGHDNLASFSPRGTSDTASVYLRPARDAAAGRTDRERRITVLGSTARVRALRWTGSAWE